MAKIPLFIEREEWEEYKRTQSEINKKLIQLTSVQCGVCGKTTPAEKILGKCIRCGKVVCKSWTRNCGQRVLLSFSANNPAGVYCKDCMGKPIKKKK
jgi:hypothetical protein